MQISILLAQQIAQLFLILIMGYAVVKVGLLKASDSRVLSVVMVYLVTPCVIINAFQIDDTPEIRKGLLYSMAIAAAIHVVLLVLSALLSRPLKLDAVEQVNVIYSNAAALVIPLVKALMGDAYVIYSCAFIIVQLVLLWTHASSLLQGSRDHLSYLAFQIDRAFFQNGAVGQYSAWGGVQAAGGKFIHITAAFYAAPVHRTHQRFGGQIDGDRKSTRLNSSHITIYTLSLHDALPISSSVCSSVILPFVGCPGALADDVARTGFRLHINFADILADHA